ncbi:MAG: hypothetical protein ACKV0T_30670 [Planctomycetales bacterium]
MIPVTTLSAAFFATEIGNRFCQGDNLLRVDVFLVKQPTPDLAFLLLILASKSCLSQAQAPEFFETDASNRDVLVHASTPIGALEWLSRQFMWRDSN